MAGITIAGPGSAGVAGVAGASGGTAGGGGAAGVGKDNEVNCTAFPTTMEGGPTISPTTVGAVICSGTHGTFCHAENNTYSDACGSNDDFFFSIDTGAAPKRGLYIRKQQEWTVVSHSHGDDTGSVGYSYSGFPEATDISFVVASGGKNYDMKFRFDGTKITFTKFAPQ